MKFLAALRFLTIIPVPWGRDASPEELGKSTVYFPVVGIIIGLILVGSDWLFKLFLLSPVGIVLLIVSSVVISGAMHLDGLVDTFDGVSGYKTPEERWRVMSDSRAGSFGIVAVACLLLVKYVALSNVPDTFLMVTLVLMPVVSRWAMVYAVFVYSYAKPSGSGKFFKEGTRWWGFAIATFVTLVLAIALGRLMGLAIILGVWIVTIALAAYLKRKFSGLTGDTYGAISEVAEVSVLVIVGMLVG